MSCQAIETGSYEVVVNFPLSFTERRQLCLRNCNRCLRDSVKYLAYLCVGLVALFVFCNLLFSVVYVVVENCHKTPLLALEDVSIRSMAVYQNSSVGTPEDHWHVKSEFKVTLLARNNNSVVGCFSTYRRMVVYVRYHDKLILQQEVPLGFGLKPQKNRSVVVQVQGDHFPVDRQLGELLDAELRNASSVNLQMHFDTRVMRNDRKAKWIRMGCQVTARTPLKSSQMSGNLLWKRCG